MTRQGHQYSASRLVGRLRHHGPAAGGLIAALLLVVFAGPSIAGRVGDDLQQSAVAPLPSGATVADRAGPPTIAASSPAPEPASPVPQSSAQGGRPDPDVVAVPVTRLQTVPPVANVFVEIGDRRVATDETGAIDVRPDEFDEMVRFVGPVADPPLQTVELAVWSDGNTSLERSLTTVQGPVAELGLVVRSRVLVEADASTSAAVATFSTELGLVDVAVGGTSWVASTVTTHTPAGLVATSLTYTVSALSSGENVSEQTFRPTPEATWRLEPPGTPR